MFRLSLFVSILVTIIMMGSKHVQAATYYVSTSGNDSNPGTESQPWRTIKRAAQSSNLNPGDTIYIRGGSYHVNPVDQSECYIQPSRSGTSGNPITLKAYNNEDVLLDGRWDIKLGGKTWQQDSHSGWWVLTAGWSDVASFKLERGQMWEGNTLIPTTKTGNFSPPTNGTWGMVDKATRKIYYHPANGVDPNSRQVSYASCGYIWYFAPGISNWVIDGIDEVASGVIGYTVGRGASNITLQNLKASYNGNNICATSRDGTNGHSINNEGGPGIVIKNSDFSQDVSELLHLSSAGLGGDRIENNYIHDAGMDPGWRSQCSQGYGSEYGAQQASPGIIIRSANSTIINNRFERNNYEALRIEADHEASEVDGNPSNLIISGNTFIDNVGAGVAGSCDLNENNNKVFNNYFSGNAGVFNWEGQIYLNGQCTNWQVHDNIIVNTPSNTVAIKNNAGSSNIFTNNCTANCPAFSPPPVPSSSPSPSIAPTPTPTPGTLKGDLNHDGIVNSLDWSIMNNKWFSNDTSADLNNDGIVNSLDFSIMNGNWSKSG